MITSTRQYRPGQETVLWLGCLIFLVIPSFIFAQEIVPDPNPHRFDAEIQAFAEWDAKNSFPEKAILFVGSSSIRFWKTHEAFPEYRIINRGFGGSHITDVDYFYEEVISRYDPAAIIFYAGDNDIAAGKSIEQVKEDYMQLLERVLQDYPDIQWIYLPIKPSSSRWDYWPKMKAVNEWVEKHHKGNNRLHYIDLATPLLNDNGKPIDSLYIDDLLHLNAKGYAAWNRIMTDKLKEISN